MYEELITAVHNAAATFSELKKIVGKDQVFSDSVDSNLFSEVIQKCGSYSYSVISYKAIVKHKTGVYLGKLPVIEIITGKSNVISFRVDIPLLNDLVATVEKYSDKQQYKCNRCGKVQTKYEMEKDTHYPPIIKELNCSECGACLFENGGKLGTTLIV